MKHLLHFLFKRPDGINKPFLCVGSGGASFSIHCRLGGILADEACHKVLRSLKGAAGLRCCGACRNIIATKFPDRIKDDDFLRWCATSFAKDFVQQTDADAWADIDAVARAATTPGLAKSRVEKLSTCRGCNYEEGTLMQDVALRDTYFPVTHTLYDWMHCAAASTGVGQYHVNAFLQALQEWTHFTLADVDNFACGITFGRRSSLGYLRPKFFACRYCTTPGGHIRAFASELMSAVEILKFFCVTKLDVDGLLPDHSRGIKILARILSILKLGDAAVPLSKEFLRLVELHHKEILQTYGPWMCKPKCHLLYHVESILTGLSVNLSCFSNERRNRLLCSTILHYRGNAAKDDTAPLSRLLLDLEFRISTCTFESYALVEPSLDATASLRWVFEGRPNRVKLSDAARTPAGRLTKGQFVWIRGQFNTIGFTSGFAELMYVERPGDLDIVAFVDMYSRSGEDKTLWAPADFSALVHVRDIAGSVPGMAAHGGQMRPFFPDFL